MSSANNFVISNQNGYVKVSNTITGGILFYPKAGLLIQKLNDSSFALRIDTTMTVFERSEIEFPPSTDVDELIEVLLRYTLSNDQVQVDGFGDTRVTSKTTLLDLKSTFGISSLRDIVTEENGGTVTNGVGGPEYVLAVNGADSYARLRSVQRGEYMSGHSAEIGIGIRFENANFDPGQTARWGYFDGNNGFYFEYDDSGLWATVIRDGVIKERTNMQQFNQDNLDGTGPSGQLYNPTKGNIYQINFTWYGYGTINFVIVMSGTEFGALQRAYTVHNHIPMNSTSVANPNLPLWVELSNGSSTTTGRQLYVAGRQFSIFGNPNFRYLRRVTSVYRLGFLFAQTAGFLPILSIRRKPGYLGNPIRLSSYDIGMNARILLQVRVGATLTGSSFGNVPDTTQDETAIEVDTSASALTGGIVIYTELNFPSAVEDGGGKGKGKGNGGGNWGANINTSELTYVLEEDSVVTIAASSYGDFDADIDFLLRVSEGW
jgi:hypothetical protein